MQNIENVGRDIYTTNFADYLPETLKRDSKIKAIAAAVTKQILEISNEINNVLIYSRIDDLSEELVDILAFDMHVDWYDYSYPLETKKEILKNSVKVHKKMGTKYAVEKGLRGLHPMSEVEEWFDYDGTPHHFRIVCDVSTNKIIVNYTQIVNSIKIYKRLSSWLDAVVYQSRINCTVKTYTDCFIYKNPLANKIFSGTHPQRNRKGIQYRDCIVVGMETAGFIFLPPYTGTIPERNILFRHSDSQIDTKTTLNTFKHTNTAVGKKNTGETPQRNVQGATKGTNLITMNEIENLLYSIPASGTIPERNILFRHSDSQIDTKTTLNTFKHTNTAVGKKNTGETPQRNVQGKQTDDKIVANQIQTTIFQHKTILCGNKRKL